MILLLERAAAASPCQPGVVTPEGASTYGELLDGARRVAASLRRRGIERFAVVEPDAAWVIRLLAGAALAGAEPCQYQPDTDPGEFVNHARALGHTQVVTRRGDLGDALEAVRTDDLLDADPSPQAAGPDRPQPLVIRTTGTTGTPKAVRHDWGILARTVSGVRPAPAQRWLLAYGPQQFAGIQVLLHALASQATLVAPFPRLPKDCVQAMVDEAVTCVSATPTFWRFLLAEARSRRIELPDLQQITLGGEAAPPDLLDDLRALFPRANVSQVYASTEFGSVTSVRDGRPGLPVAALQSDRNPGAPLRVEDGQLWVRATEGMLGYAGEADAREEDPADAAVADDGWRPTGDLVEIVGDRVLFRGRDSEVINVGGVKVHPLPVEERISALETVALVRVFGRPNRLTGSIVAAEIVPAHGLDEADIERTRAQIDDAVADLPRAARPRSITFVESIETTGGKTVRQETRA
jgi:acyl-CoA synthetase (AMP-forming)/AMP-acid ligase II